MWIQLVLIAGIVVIGAFFMRRTGADSHLAIRRLCYLAFIALAVGAVLFPEMLTKAANLVGVGRGTDLLLYLFVLIFMSFVYAQHRRGTDQQRKLTLLARRIALLEAIERQRDA